MPVTIRRARRGDEKSIARFAIRLFEQHVTYDPERFSMFATQEGAESYYRSRFDVDEAAVIVADLDNEVVGFAYVEKEERNYAALLENAAWLHDIFIDDAARHTGAGHKLLEAAIAAAGHLGASKLMLTVAAKNVPAKNFFERFGFETTMYEMMLSVNE